MDFDTVRLLGNSQRSITLPLYPGYSLSTYDRYICKGIIGLEPPPIDIHLSETPQFPGHLQSRHPQAREIITKIGFNPYFTRIEGQPQSFGDLRDHMYRTVLSPNSKGELTFQLLKASDLTTPLAQIRGYVRQFEASIFSKDPETQISLLCSDPYLHSPSTTALVNLGSASAPKFNNEGGAPVGFILTIVFTSTLGSFTLSNSFTEQSMTITRSLPSGAAMTIDTRPGSRGIFLQPSGGSVSNILGSLSSTSDWLILEPGMNDLAASSSAYTISSGHYNRSWWGV